MNSQETQANQGHVSARQNNGATLAFLTALAIFFVWGGPQVMPWDRMFPDFISHWTAGEILASGQSPYSSELQTRVHQKYGFDKAANGLGIYDFLPFYYPPWFAFLWVLAVPLGFAGAKVAWFFINVELSLLTGYLLKQALPGIPGWIPLTIVPCFLFTITIVVLGQTSIFVFFLIVLGWRLLDLGHDRWAGAVMAWMTIKPQLTAILLLALLIWLVRRRRWAAVNSFLMTLAVLISVSTLILPTWPFQMWSQMRETPMPTDYYPWIGNTWFLLLRTFGLKQSILWLLYLAVALPFLGWVSYTAFQRSTTLADILALSVLAAFFVAPYARHYDFPVLLIAVLVLLAKCPSSATLRLLVTALVLLPFLQLFLLAHFKVSGDSSSPFLLEGSFFWIPALCLVSWLFAILGGPQGSVLVSSKD